MSRPRGGHRPVAVIVVSVVAAVTVAVVGSLTNRSTTGPSRPLVARRVIVFMIPGVTWSDVRAAHMPVFDRLAREGATAALAVRSASVRPSSIRGYVTLGAGNRGAGPRAGELAEKAYEADEVLGNGLRAEQMLTSEVGSHRRGQIVHLAVPALVSRQRSLYHGAEVGALGEALARAGISRGIVSAADLARQGKPPDTGRGSPVLAAMDGRGVVPVGVIRGLVERAPGEAFGVRTDPVRFRLAFDRVLNRSRVVFVEPGETLRADDFASLSLPERTAVLRGRALERTDALLSGVVAKLDRGDLLIVVGPSSATSEDSEHLTPLVAWGRGVDPGMLVSASTLRPGTVTLTDVAPTVLSALGVDRPGSMSGRPLRQVRVPEMNKPAAHDELDQRSVFREHFAPEVFYELVGLFVVLSILVGLVFLARLPLQAPLVAICYMILALPLVSFLLTVVPLWRIGKLQAHVVLWLLTIALAGAGRLVRGPRWAGTVPLLLSTVVFVAVALLMGGDLLVNAVFGNSVLAAGRFYGISNTGSALFFGASVLAIAGLAEFWGVTQWRSWMTIGLGLVVLLTGLPGLGADVGGLLTGTAAIAAILLATRGDRIRWKVVAVVVVVALAVTLLAGFYDSLRSTEQQTHLGRFFDELVSGGGVAGLTVRRKATQALASLSISRFSYVVPLGVAALGVLLRSPRGPLRGVLPQYPLFRAGLVGLLVAGVLGFALNDSGVAVPALLLAEAVPLVVLLGVEHAGPRPNNSFD